MRAVDLHPDPLQQFRVWYQQAEQAKEETLDAMTLATVNENDQPTARIVLYKGIDHNTGGFLLFTNYRSPKAQMLLHNPSAALVFYWPRLYRQVRVEGQVKKITRKESMRYYNTRSYESRLSALISPQSQVIPNRDFLLRRHQEARAKFPPEKITCPDFWGGLCLNPIKIEFWIGADHRLHDRFCYSKQDDKWKIARLAP